MQNIDFLLKKAIEEDKMEAPLEVWPLIEAGLRKRERKRIVGFFILFFTMLFVCISSLLVYQSKNGMPNKRYHNSSQGKKKVNSIITIKAGSVNQKDTFLTAENYKDKRNKILEKKQNNFKSEKYSLNNNSKIINNKRIVFKNSSAIITDLKENIFDKNQFLNKTKARSKTTIQSSTGLETQSSQDGNILTAKNDLAIIQLETVNRIENNLSLTKDSLSNSLKTVIEIKTDNNINIDENNTSKATTKKIKSLEKWATYVGISYAALFTNSKSIFNNENKNLSTGAFQASPTIGQANNNTTNSANYLNGKEMAVSILWKKETRKWHPMLGFTINMGSFKAKVYEATGALINPTSLLVDSSQAVNSNFASVRSVGNTQVNINNNYMQFGLVVGYNIPLYSFKKGDKILLQVQAIPTYSLSQSIQWHDELSGRYFNSKKLNNKFNITQSTALLWNRNIKSRNFLIGPYFNFNYFKLNKSATYITNIFTQSIGAQIQIKLKK